MGNLGPGTGANVVVSASNKFTASAGLIDQRLFRCHRTNQIGIWKEETIQMIRKFMGTIAIGSIFVAGMGLARGWLSFASSAEDGKAKLEIAVDKEILHSDVSRVRTGVSSFVASILGEGSTETESESEDLSLTL